MNYASFIAPGYAYTSYPGWLSWGLFGGGVLAGPPAGGGMTQAKKMYDAFHIY